MNGYTCIAIILTVFFGMVTVENYNKEQAKIAIATQEAKVAISNNERIAKLAALAKECK
jgi:hypothetical protein